MRAWIRDLHGVEHDTEFVVVQPGAIAVTVAGFGHMIVSHFGPIESWHAILAQGPGRGELQRDVRAVDGHAEIEVLPNPSGEDRIVVCVEP